MQSSWLSALKFQHHTFCKQKFWLPAAHVPPPAQRYIVISSGVESVHLSIIQNILSGSLSQKLVWERLDKVLSLPA